MSRKGSLIAYSTPANIKQIRDQAALASMALTDQADHAGLSTQRAGHSVEVLTVESDEYNLIAQKVQDDLYLVLLGKCAPQALPPDVEEPDDAQDSADMSNVEDDPQVNIFTATDCHSFAEEIRKAHQSKTNSLVKYIRTKLEGFSMPSDASYGG